MGGKGGRKGEEGERKGREEEEEEEEMIDLPANAHRKEPSKVKTRIST